MKKLVALSLAALLMAGMTGCGNSIGKMTSSVHTKNNTPSGKIVVISWKNSAEICDSMKKLLGIETDDSDENLIDPAEASGNTADVMQAVAANEGAIGYIPLEALDKTVKAIQVDGVDPKTKNITEGTYTMACPFNLVSRREFSPAVKDLMDYIMSKDGQRIIYDSGYASLKSMGDFTGGKVSGEVTVTGSPSVAPLMRKLARAYRKVNGKVTVTIEPSNEATGVESVAEGQCDIGMLSRNLTDGEKEEGVASTRIGAAGIAVIIHNTNCVTNLSRDQIKDIFTGKTKNWSSVVK